MDPFQGSMLAGTEQPLTSWFCWPSTVVAPGRKLELKYRGTEQRAPPSKVADLGEHHVRPTFAALPEAASHRTSRTFALGLGMCGMQKMPSGTTLRTGARAACTQRADSQGASNNKHRRACRDLGKSEQELGKAKSRRAGRLQAANFNYHQRHEVRDTPVRGVARRAF